MWVEVVETGAGIDLVLVQEQQWFLLADECFEEDVMTEKVVHCTDHESSWQTYHIPNIVMLPL